MDDLELDLQDPEEPISDAIEEGKPEVDKLGSAAGESPDGASEASGPEGSGVTVEVDKVIQPGAVVSGNATMPDGVTLKWYLDQMGRLGLTPPEGLSTKRGKYRGFPAEVASRLARCRVLGSRIPLPATVVQASGFLARRVSFSRAFSFSWRVRILSSATKGKLISRTTFSSTRMNRMHLTLRRSSSNRFFSSLEIAALAFKYMAHCPSRFKTASNSFDWSGSNRALALG